MERECTAGEDHHSAFIDYLIIHFILTSDKNWQLQSDAIDMLLPVTFIVSPLSCVWLQGMAPTGSCHKNYLFLLVGVHRYICCMLGALSLSYNRGLHFE
jgi:hypothetical protein